MKKSAFIICCFFSILIFGYRHLLVEDNLLITSYVVDLKKQKLQFYLKDEKGASYKTFSNLRKNLELKGEKVIFAMNGGMFDEDLDPSGLFVEKGVLKKDIDTVLNGYGNFYLQPNGVFYLTKRNKGVVVQSKDFVMNVDIEFATQSGPMLVINGIIHSKFNKESTNLNIRNGVGVLPNGDLLFAISKEKINFYDFANYFKSKGCENALYLDGFVSKVYLPSKNLTEDNHHSFGVIIAEIAK